MYREDFDRASAQERNVEDVFSRPVRAGKRTYFFDVKTTKDNSDFYLTITESKRRVEKDGSYTYDKHKIFLYKEDFDKFQEGLIEAIDYIKKNCLKDGEGDFSSRFSEKKELEGNEGESSDDDGSEQSNEGSGQFTDVKFDEF